MRPVLLFVVAALLFCQCHQANNNSATVAQRQRIIVSTDIGGTDFDDYQSLVHLLVYADAIDLEGIISSPYGEGRKEQILEAIAAYEKDYPKLRSHSEHYPSADSLRSITKQGEKLDPGPVGYSSATEGSEWIIERARVDDPRPLNVLIWGGIEDLAQALHDAPDILPKLRVYFIGGPNKKWTVNAYQYIAENFPKLWIIESNATYRGWFVGGDQTEGFDNKGFVAQYVKPYGALGAYFYAKGREMKMGDTPSLTYFLRANPSDAAQAGWGGHYVRAWDRPHKVFHRITTIADSIEEFGVLELLLPFDGGGVSEPFATMHIDRKIPAQIKNDTVRFLFSPKKATDWEYRITSNIESLNGLEAKLVSYLTPAANKHKPSAKYPNWWVDDPSPEYLEDGHIGAKTVNRWRKDFLVDFAERMKRCAKTE